MDIEIRHPLNCIRLLMKRLGIRKKLINDVAEMFEFQKGNGSCAAHDLYFAMNEASFFAACEGMQGAAIINLEAGLEEGVIVPATEVFCDGVFDKVSPPLKCWNIMGHQSVTSAASALQNSCNDYLCGRFSISASTGRR